MNNVAHLDHLNMNVRDLSESISWYARVFGFQKVEEGLWNEQPWAIVKSGEAMLCLYESPEGKHQRPGDIGILGVNHFGLRIRNQMDWEQRVRALELSVEYGGPLTYPHSLSWYLRDPSGHQIEVVLWHDDVVRFDAPSVPPVTESLRSA